MLLLLRRPVGVVVDHLGMTMEVLMRQDLLSDKLICQDEAKYHSGREHDRRPGGRVEIETRIHPMIVVAVPIAVARRIIRLKLSVSNRADTAGMTIAAAIIVTPITCIEAMIEAARISEKAASTHCVGTPYTCAASRSKIVKRSCL